MSLNIIVCDDSKFARNQLIRVIPKNLIANLYQANNGLEEMNLLHEGKGNLLFLDLTMPVMDGYQVLAAIKKENIDVLTIVISGDIQLQAQKIIASYNALAFLKKPLDKDELYEVLEKYGLIDNDNINENETTKTYANNEQNDKFDELKEKINISAGIAASKIGDFLNLFVNMPIPKVRIKKGMEIYDDMNNWLNDEGNVIISQGFIGLDILGENLNFFSKEDINSFLSMLGENNADSKTKLSLIMELSGLLSGSVICLSKQFNVDIKLNHPVFIKNADNNLAKDPLKSGDILCVELTYEIKDLKIKIPNYILFTNNTTLKLKELLEFI